MPGGAGRLGHPRKCNGPLNFCRRGGAGELVENIEVKDINRIERAKGADQFLDDGMMRVSSRRRLGRDGSLGAAIMNVLAGSGFEF